MKRAVLLIIILINSICSYAQNYDGTVGSLITLANNYKQTSPAEKLYLQLDKTNYGLNDTLWFKAYLFNSATLQPSKQSKIVYIELSDENNTVLLRRLVEMNYGLGWGSIALPRRDFTEGGYTIRAYTQWMRNFDESLVYKQQFFVSDVNRSKWLLNLTPQINNRASLLDFQLLDMNKHPVAGQQILTGVRQGEAILRRDKPEITPVDGKIRLEFSVKDRPEPVYGFFHKGSYDDLGEPVFKFPVIYNRAEKADVQFMPEGGYAVAGIESKVGFKIIGEDGKGVNLQGSILNDKNEQIATFAATSKGMGSFMFKPETGVTYKAVVTLANSLKKEYAFPAVKPLGTVLSVTNPPQGDSLTIKITTSPGLNEHYILLGQTRGMITYGAKLVLMNNTQTLKAPKSAFASGIVRFSLLNEQLATLNERIVYIDHKDNLQINITPDKTYYAPQDSIALHLEVKDSNNQPVEGAFSMSVVNELRLNSNQQTGSIITDLLLTSDLKGDVEDPTYYFEDGHQQEMDELLLTQGWTGIDWKDVVKPQAPLSFKAETEYSISGKVINLFGNAAKQVNVNLLSVYPYYNVNLKTDDKGLFTFKNIPQIDSALFIRARNKNDRPTTYEVQLDNPAWPIFNANKLQLPWYVNTNAAILQKVDTLISSTDKINELESAGSTLLQEVNIKAKKIVAGSHNLNGNGNADQVLDQHDIFKAGNVTLLELLQKLVKDFRVRGLGRNLKYSIKSDAIGGFIFDGINPDPLHISRYDLLTTYNSSDIIGIEVMFQKYTSAYELKFDIHGLFPVPFIEITTRAGDGPFKKTAPASVLYKPVPIISDRQFYRPAYRIKNTAVAAFDQRTTIHWEPNIITDKDGKATITFYAAGQPATYTITTEGSNMYGDIGSRVQKLEVK